MKQFLLVCCLAFSACGPLVSDSPAKAGLNLAMNALGRGDAPEQPAVTPELAAAGEGGILFVTLRQQGAILPMTQIGTNGAVETWKHASGITLAIEDELVVASRGLGYDLMGADPVGVLEAISAGGGATTRDHSYLNSLDQIETFRVTCEVTRIGVEDVELPRGTQSLVHFQESCESRRLIFKNEYWTNRSGNIVRSIQVLSPSLGFVLLERA